MDVVRISDGLGNQMFQYAFARKLHIMTKRPVLLDNRFINNEDMYSTGELQNMKGKLEHREYGLDNFKIRLPIADKRTLLKWNYLKKENMLDRTIYDLAKENFWLWRYVKEDLNMPEKYPSIINWIGSTYYQGYFFEREYFDDIKCILQKEFRLKETIKLPKDLRQILKSENTVSVHIRRGDFLRINRDISQSDYYSKAFDFIQEKIERPVYLVFTDDMEWVKDNLYIPENKIYVGELGFKDYQELAIMKHCKNNIIANSTFSYWAAYLNENEEKLVICPKRWKTSIIPEDWIKL